MVKPLDTSRASAAVCALSASKRYGTGPAAVTALDDVTVAFLLVASLRCWAGRAPGKSTLLRCLAGLDGLTPEQSSWGTLSWGSLSERELTRLRRDRIEFRVSVPFNLLPVLTAGGHAPLRLAGRAPDRSWTDRVIDAVGLRERLGNRPGELSRRR